MEAQHSWHPTWHTPEHEMGWARVREAVRRDWQQTRHDMHVGGHELNQRASDTLEQAVGSAAIPSTDRTSPRKARDEWEWVEQPAEYGQSARLHFGSIYPEWCRELDQQLQREWPSDALASMEPGLWDDVKASVRYGYDFKS